MNDCMIGGMARFESKLFMVKNIFIVLSQASRCLRFSPPVGLRAGGAVIKTAPAVPQPVAWRYSTCHASLAIVLLLATCWSMVKIIVFASIGNRWWYCWLQALPDDLAALGRDTERLMLAHAEIPHWTPCTNQRPQNGYPYITPEDEKKWSWVIKNIISIQSPTS